MYLDLQLFCSCGARVPLKIFLWGLSLPIRKLNMIRFLDSQKLLEKSSEGAVAP